LPGKPTIVDRDTKEVRDRADYRLTVLEPKNGQKIERSEERFRVRCRVELLGTRNGPERANAELLDRRKRVCAAAWLTCDPAEGGDCTILVGSLKTPATPGRYSIEVDGLSLVFEKSKGEFTATSSKHVKAPRVEVIIK
jgi:hypothetical protein